jgi:hypothetical protein
MVLDMDERTLSYGTNGTDHGVAFTGLPDEVPTAHSPNPVWT